EKDSGKTRGVGGKERVLYATHTAAYDAKNRHGLPDKLPFSIDALAPVFGSSPATASPALQAPAQSATDRIPEVFGEHMADVVDFLIERGQLKRAADGSPETIDTLDPTYAARMIAEPKRFLSTVQEWVKGKEVAK
ncbi:MAG: hypothetical protein WCO57_17175, partial [Verrucomicrobiota bacterium]